MLHRPAVQAEIQRLKAVKRAGILADGDDVIEQYMRIAFADMSDIAVWAYDKKKGRSRAAVIPSTQVDGQLVAEVSETKDGFRIKRLEPYKALEFLAQYFLLNPMDKHRKAYEEKRLELDERRADAEIKASVSGDTLGQHLSAGSHSARRCEDWRGRDGQRSCAKSDALRGCSS